MLAIGIELHCIIVALFIGIAHSCLKGSSKTKVHWQVNNVVTMLAANGKRIVFRAIVDDNVINPWRIGTQVFNCRNNIVSFVVRRNNRKHAATPDSVVHFRTTP